MVAPNPHAPFKAREDGLQAVLPVENPRLRRPRTCPRGEGTYTFSAAPGTEGNYLDEVWTIDKRSGGVTVADLNDGTGGQRHFYHSSTLYHVYALTDETGAIAEAVQSYDAYGKISALITGAGTDGNWFTSDDVLATNPNVSAIGNPWFYTGQRVDAETGLQYSKNRYLSVDLGRWVSRDPIGYGAGHPNLYCYVLSKVTRRLDAFGLQENPSITVPQGSVDVKSWGPKQIKCGELSIIVGADYSTTRSTQQSSAFHQNIHRAEKSSGTYSNIGGGISLLFNPSEIRYRNCPCSPRSCGWVQVAEGGAQQVDAFVDVMPGEGTDLYTESVNRFLKAKAPTAEGSYPGNTELYKLYDSPGVDVAGGRAKKFYSCLWCPANAETGKFDNLIVRVDWEAFHTAGNPNTITTRVTAIRDDDPDGKCALVNDPNTPRGAQNARPRSNP